MLVSNTMVIYHGILTLEKVNTAVNYHGILTLEKVGTAVNYHGICITLAKNTTEF
jgi:hypothetical protein